MARRKPKVPEVTSLDPETKLPETPEVLAERKRQGVQEDLGRGELPAAPDWTDLVLQDARRAQALRLLAGRGRRSTFLTGAGAGTYLGGSAMGGSPGTTFLGSGR